LDPSSVSHLVATDEVLMQKIYNIRRVPFMPDIVLDCGANIGVFTLLAMATFPRATVVAFEPDPENLIWLRRQAELNGASFEIVDAAVSIADGEALFAAGLGVGSTLALGENAGGTVIFVSTIRLATFIERKKAGSLLLKLDVEGAEEAVIPDLVDVLPAKCAIFFETHRGEKAWRAIDQTLVAAGFKVDRVRTRDPYSEGFALRSEVT
jgi:FkbM family methyltransferase